MSVIIRKLNESFVQIKNYDQELYKKLRERFTFYSPNYRFNPKYKAGYWDGKISLFDSQNDTIPIGLFPDLYKIVKTKTNDIICDFSLFEKGYDISKEEILNFCKAINLPFKPYEHQINAIQKAIQKKRIILESATSSGKSFIQFVICNFLKLKNDKEKILIIVPTVQLVEQMAKDFCDYAKNFCDYSENIKKIYSGQGKEINKQAFIVISTYQSLSNIKNNKVFEAFTSVICDEAHTATSLSISNIVSKCTNAEFKIGCTGSLSNEKVHEMQLKGLFGSVEKIISARQLIEKDMAANFDIKGIILEYNIDDRIILKNKLEGIKTKKRKEIARYTCEMELIRGKENRLNFFVDFANKIDKNSIFLFKNIEYGRKLFRELRLNTKKRVYYIDGSIDVLKREEIRANLERYNNCILVTSFGTFSTGINVKNIYNAVLVESMKSPIKIIQTIGRILRKLPNKNAVLFDIADELSLNRFTNYSMRHFKSRLSTYKKERHEVKVIKIKI